MTGARLLLALISGLPFAAPHPSAIKYRRYKLFELVCCADLVVAGSISDIDTTIEWSPLPHRELDTFTFEIEETIVGQGLPKSIEVQCFKNWTCASRYAKYEKGQREVLFLAAPNKDSKTYRILGGGDEGEMPLDGDAVFAHGYAIRGHLTPGAATEEAPVHGSKVPRAEFAAAVRGFRENLTWDLDARSALPIAVRPAENIEKAKTYAATSAMARQLLEDVRSSEAWGGPVDSLPALALPEGVRTRRDEAADFATSMCALGDVDGDGLVDLAAGDAYDSKIINQHGALRILFLAADGSVKGRRELNETVGTFPARMNEFAQLGRGVAPVGDINGDGVPDLVVSAPGNGGSWKGRGSVWILCLERSGSAKQAIEIDGDEKLKQLGVKIGSGLGSSIAALGDLDGDGLPEVAIGQDPEFDKGIEAGRSVFLVSLGSGGVVRWARRIHDRQDGFSEGYSWFGESVAGLGDVDGDGVPDLAASDPHNPGGGEIRGAVWIVCLHRDGSIKSKHEISDWSGDFDGRLRDWSSLGRELYPLGDIDADGIPDLAASTAEGLWFLSLNRGGVVRESRVLPADTRSESLPRRRFFSVLRMRESAAVAEPRFILGGWVSEQENSRQGTQWFLRFGAQGKLLSW